METKKYEQREEKKRCKKIGEDNPEIGFEEVIHIDHWTKALDEPARHHTEHEGATSRAVEKEQKEKFVVVETHTVGNPRTVVIHPKNASVANAAVMGAVRLVAIASAAKPQLRTLLARFCLALHDGQAL